MAGRVGADPLILNALGNEPAGEQHTSVTRPIISDHPADGGDAISGEERFHVAPEFKQSLGGLIKQNLGIDQPREPVDNAVQVGVADLLSRPSLAAAVSSPAGAVRDPTLLMSRWIM